MVLHPVACAHLSSDASIGYLLSPHTLQTPATAALALLRPGEPRVLLAAAAMAPSNAGIEIGSAVPQCSAWKAASRSSPHHALLCRLASMGKQGMQGTRAKAHAQMLSFGVRASDEVSALMECPGGPDAMQAGAELLVGQPVRARVRNCCLLVAP